MAAPVPLRGFRCSDAPDRLAVWCPWCETHHEHGSPPGVAREMRGAHCGDGATSPHLGRSYQIEVAEVRDLPRGRLPFGRRLTLLGVLTHNAPMLRRVVQSYILGPAAKRDSVILIDNLVVHSCDCGVSWSVATPDGIGLARGAGLAQLAAALTGESVGTVLADLIDIFFCLEPTTDAAIVAAGERWIARGGFGRPRRAMATCRTLYSVEADMRRVPPGIPNRLGSGATLASAIDGMAGPLTVRACEVGLWSSGGPDADLTGPAGRLIQNRYASAWSIELIDGASYSGTGLGTLLGRVYGTGPGVAAVRLLEAASGTLLDADAALEIAAAVDAAHRGGGAA